jgi:hypothetical protein
MRRKTHIQAFAGAGAFAGSSCAQQGMHISAFFSIQATHHAWVKKKSRPTLLCDHSTNSSKLMSLRGRGIESAKALL